MPGMYATHLRKLFTFVAVVLYVSSVLTIRGG